MAKAQSTVGAGYKLYINNRIFGIATGFEFTTGAGRRPIFGLDNVGALELAPANNSVTGKVDCIRIRLDGGLEGRGIAARDEDVMLEKYISIILIDRLTDSVVFRCDQAAVQQQTWRVDAKQVMRGNFTFLGIDWTNETQN
jgi:hypothetical protein